MFRSYARNGNELQTPRRLGSIVNIENHGFQIPVKIQNSPENHETWHGVMTWHQHAVVKKFTDLGQVLV